MSIKLVRVCCVCNFVLNKTNETTVEYKEEMGIPSHGYCHPHFLAEMNKIKERKKIIVTEKN